MAYFFLTERLLTESSFLSFVSKVNEDFIFRDEAEYEHYLANGKSFKLELKDWLDKCKDRETTRMESDLAVDFRTFAGNRINTLIQMDLDNYVKDFRSGKITDNSKFSTELTDITERMAAAPYMAPVIDGVFGVFGSIPADVRPASLPVNTGAPDENDCLTWNGKLETLCDLFKDLCSLKTDGSGKTYLEHQPDELGDFISRHFRDAAGKPFSIADITMALQSDNTDRPSGKNKIVIGD
jgi:hypothetical protein